LFLPAGNYSRTEFFAVCFGLLAAYATTNGIATAPAARNSSHTFAKKFLIVREQLLFGKTY